MLSAERLEAILITVHGELILRIRHVLWAGEIQEGLPDEVARVAPEGCKAMSVTPPPCAACKRMVTKQHPSTYVELWDVPMCLSQPRQKRRGGLRLVALCDCAYREEADCQPQ